MSETIHDVDVEVGEHGPVVEGATPTPQAPVPRSSRAAWEACYSAYRDMPMEYRKWVMVNRPLSQHIEILGQQARAFRSEAKSENRNAYRREKLLSKAEEVGEKFEDIKSVVNDAYHDVLEKLFSRGGVIL